MHNNKYSVLIVDDEKAIRDLLFKVLTANQYRVFWAKSGPDALKILDENSIDLVITDISMPEMDGTDLANRIRYKFENLPIVVLSGQGTRENFIRSIKSGAIDFVVKGSLDLKSFVERIGGHLGTEPMSRSQSPSEPFAKKFSATLNTKKKISE